jgi:hypothetical protein
MNGIGRLVKRITIVRRRARGPRRKRPILRVLAALRGKRRMVRRRRLGRRAPKLRLAVRGIRAWRRLKR